MRFLGMVKINLAPWPRLDSTRTWPPWSSTAALTMAKPTPEPSYWSAGVQPFKNIENFLMMLRVNTDPIVLNIKLIFLRGFIPADLDHGRHIGLANLTALLIRLKNTAVILIRSQTISGNLLSILISAPDWRIIKSQLAMAASTTSWIRNPRIRIFNPGHFRQFQHVLDQYTKPRCPFTHAFNAILPPLSSGNIVVSK